MIDRRFDDFLGLEPDGLHARGLCSFGGGGGGGNTNTIQSTTPWAGQQGYLTGNDTGAVGIYPTANSMFQNNSPAYYPGNTYASLTPQQQQVMNQIIGQGEGGGTQALQAANQNIASTLSPGYTNATSGAFNQGQGVLSNELNPAFLNPWNSPSFGTVVGNTLASAIPAATSSFTNGNRSDSGLATRAATMAATDAVGNLAQNQYQANQVIQNQAQQQAANEFLTQQGNQIKSAGISPYIDAANTTDLTTALNTAGVSQTDLQNQIAAAMARFNYGQMAPWNTLSLYENAITGAGSPGSQTTTSQPYFSNTGANVLSGLSAAGSLAALGSSAAQTAGYAGGLFGLGGSGATGFAGSLAGSLFGGGTALSDKRMKEDITRIGESDSGFPLYTFRYKGETPMARHIGVMAQDVEKKRPEAVGSIFGVKFVNYDKALAA